MEFKLLIKKLVGKLGIDILLVSFLTSCSVEPVAFNYGADACSFCKMNIVDKRHAAELVTNKGKVFKYDAIECLLNDLKNREESSIGLFLVNTYLPQKELVDATKGVFYLISEKIPSPMGANLSAFNSKNSALEAQKNNGGEVFSWIELQKKFSIR